MKAPAIAPFAWPAGRRCAVSLCFDDGKPSQLHLALPALRARHLPASFYLDTAKMEGARPSVRGELLRRWAAVRAEGHELGNHSHTHPCTANFPWIREVGRALEDLTLDDMASEIARAQRFLATELGHRPTTFAYPCGQTFVGRGAGRHSYVPLVAREFLIGRSFNDEAPASPTHCDLACVPAQPMDGRSLAQLLERVEETCVSGTWLILVGHSVAERAAPLATLREAFEGLLDHLCQRADVVWTDTVETVGRYLIEARDQAVSDPQFRHPDKEDPTPDDCPPTRPFVTN
jgi:peptidoglycan/xylan/chitin deacetylase (PgdA/CDA1 family)